MALVCLSGSPWAAAWAVETTVIRYQAKTDAHWHHRESKQLCTLSLALGDYGEARFIASPSMRPVFELQPHKDMHAEGPIRVVKYTPAWHPNFASREVLGVLKHMQGAGATARGKLSSHMLSALRQGLSLEFSAPTWFDSDSELLIEVSAKEVRPAMDAFVACAHSNTLVSWKNASRTRIGYAVDQFSLNDAGRQSLTDLARYVLEDSSIRTLYIDGHTDASGTSQKNLELARHRANEVAAFLRSCGLDNLDLVVRYHGAAYPISDNSTTRGKAKNRRTTVRLERSDLDTLAQH